MRAVIVRRGSARRHRGGRGGRRRRRLQRRNHMASRRHSSQAPVSAPIRVRYPPLPSLPPTLFSHPALPHPHFTSTSHIRERRTRRRIDQLVAAAAAICASSLEGQPISELPLLLLSVAAAVWFRVLRDVCVPGWHGRRTGTYLCCECEPVAGLLGSYHRITLCTQMHLPTAAHSTRRSRLPTTKTTPRPDARVAN